MLTLDSPKLKNILDHNLVYFDNINRVSLWDAMYRDYPEYIFINDNQNSILKRHNTNNHKLNQYIHPYIREYNWADLYDM